MVATTPADSQTRVGDVRTSSDRLLEQLPDRGGSQRLGLQRYEDLGSGRQPVDREQPKRRWTVEQGKLVVIEQRRQCPRQGVLPPSACHQIDLGSGEIDGRWEYVAPRRLPQDGAGFRPTHDHVEERLLQLVGIDPGGVGEPRLGSRSTNKTRRPRSASAAPSECTVVVFATPPF